MEAIKELYCIEAPSCKEVDIEVAYEAFFAREADAEGLAYYNDLLEEMGEEVLEVLAQNAQGEDREILQKRLESLEIAQEIMKKEGKVLDKDDLGDMLFNLSIIDEEIYPLQEYVHDYIKGHGVEVAQEVAHESASDTSLLLNDLLFV